MIKEKNIFRFVAILVMFSLLLPVGARNVPLIGKSYFVIVVWFGLIFLTKPKLLFAKPMLWSYVAFLVNVFLVLFFDKEKSHSGVIQVGFSVFLQYATLLTALNMNLYFIKKQDFKGYRIVILTALAFILITTITSSIGLKQFPHASRTMAAGTESADYVMHALYRKIGIAGYGFYAMAAFLIPALGYYFQKLSRIYEKIFFFLALILVVYSTGKAMHTTILLFAVAGFFISLVDLSNRLRLKLTLFAVSLAIFNYALPPLLDGIAELLPPDSSVTFRLHDVAKVLREGDFDTSTSDSYFVNARLGRTEQSLDYFLANPLIGSAKSAGHAYWIDKLAKIGLLGFIPYLMIFVSSIKFNVEQFSSAFKPYYYTVILLMIIFGFIKNMVSSEIWLGFFFLVPGVYYLTDKNLRDGSIYKIKNLK